MRTRLGTQLLRARPAVAMVRQPAPPIPGRPPPARWPPQKEVRGLVALRLDPEVQASSTAQLRVHEGVLTVGKPKPGANELDPAVSQTIIMARVPVDELVVTLFQRRPKMFCLSSRCQSLSDKIYCFTDTEEKRNKWVAVFRRMDVRIFGEIGDASTRQTVEMPSVFGAAS